MNSAKAQKGTTMTREELDIMRLGIAKEMGDKVVKHAPKQWLYCERMAPVVAEWACDSYMGSIGMFREWVLIEGGETRKDIEKAVTAEIIALRLERARSRRAWSRTMVQAFGSEEQAHRAEHVDPPRTEVDSAVFSSIGCSALPGASPVCSKCDAIMGRTTDRLLESKFRAIADSVRDIVSRGCGPDLSVDCEAVIATYRCSVHGLLVRHELDVRVENIDNGWVGRRRVDLAACGLISDVER